MKKPISLIILFFLLGVSVLVVLMNFDVFKKDSSRPAQSIQSLKEKKTGKETTQKEIVVEPPARNENSIRSDDYEIARINSGSTGLQQITKKEEDVPTRGVEIWSELD